ncbi:MAG TPA: hypothetical protein PK820_06855 [Candidatus Competibacteraceae bacterium]|nr:hypothetical protein [Candidatus Competibacteraceae bacterium]
MGIWNGLLEDYDDEQDLTVPNSRFQKGAQPPRPEYGEYCPSATGWPVALRLLQFCFMMSSSVKI